MDDLLLAGTPHARRQKWAALKEHVGMRDAPEPLSRFLGVKFETRATGQYTRLLRASQQEYVKDVVRKCEEAAPFPASERSVPTVKRSDVCSDPGERARDCRTHVGALMYIARGTRPDVTFGVNRLARQVTCWSKTDDADLAHMMGYLKGTSSHGLDMRVDVRDRKGELWLELWVDADHAGDADRRPTGGWVLMLRGAHGTKIALDWASKKQRVVARSSGEAETTSLHEAVKDAAEGYPRGLCLAAQLAVGANRALCSGGIPAVDFFEKVLGRDVPLRAYVDATVCKAAAEKGTSKQMRYPSKTQGVDLFWLRDVVKEVPVGLRKTDSASNMADGFTKPLPKHRTEEMREALGVE